MILFSAIPVLSSLLTGFFVSLFQSVTQIQESTLSFVPKFLAVSLSLVLTTPFIARELVSFYELLIKHVASMA
ncbi:flagellar biosynthetic protein FliQ [Myxococcota bacterium]|nr:flagellar biosynthetic protein FliQ [Myxococcota bacterium]